MNFKNLFSSYLIKTFTLLFIVYLILFTNSQFSEALQMDNADKGITEELRLTVSPEYKDIWIRTEKEVWEPWLANQEGFLGRQIFYNKKKGEALLLVHWKNKKLWKNISVEEVNKIQDIFERKIKALLQIESNPFQLVYEGELIEQK